MTSSSEPRRRVVNLCAARDVRSARTSVLARFGYDVVEASTAAEARALVQSGDADLLLVDSDRTAADTTSLVRDLCSGDASGIERGFAVVLLCRTGRLRAHDVAHGIGAGADACLIEPVASDGLRTALDAVLARLDRTRRRDEECRLLRERDTRHRVLAATLGEMVYDWDLTTDTVEWNVTLIRKLRYQPEEVVPTSQWWLDRIHPDDRPHVVRAVHRTFTACQTGFEAEYRFAYADQGYAVVVDSATVMYDERTRPVRVVGIMKDVTERRHLAEQLRTAQKMEAIGRLAGGIAHDFNNILTAILGFAMVLKEALRAQPDLAGQAAEIEAAATSAARLTRQLLAFSSRQMLTPVVLRLNDVVTSSSSLIERLIGEHIRIEVALSDADPCVTADRGQLEQVLVNLAVNSRDAMPNGGMLRFATGLLVVGDGDAATRGWSAGTYAHLSVTDTGIGMDEETRTRVFEPFFTTKEAGHGTGLGLSTVYGSVTQVGGHVTVTSVPGEGSTFDVYLPATAGPPPEQEPARTTRSSSPEQRSGETVLLVEDESGVRSLVERVLRNAGYHVVAAADGKSALEAAGTHQGSIDLLLTDVVLPGVSGFRIAERLQRQSPELRVLYMSGYSDEMHGGSSRTDAPRRVLQKPFSPDLLLTHVRAALDELPASPASDPQAEV